MDKVEGQVVLDLQSWEGKRENKTTEQGENQIFIRDLEALGPCWQNARPLAGVEPALLNEASKAVIRGLPVVR